jgi:hypothetical protein
VRITVISVHEAGASIVKALNCILSLPSIVNSQDASCAVASTENRKKVARATDLSASMNLIFSSNNYVFDPPTDDSSDWIKEQFGNNSK